MARNQHQSWLPLECRWSLLCFVYLFVCTFKRYRLQCYNRWRTINPTNMSYWETRVVESIGKFQPWTVKISQEVHVSTKLCPLVGWGNPESMDHPKSHSLFGLWSWTSRVLFVTYLTTRITSWLFFFHGPLASQNFNPVGSMDGKFT